MHARGHFPGGIRTLAAMTRACAEIARTLRPDAPFVLESSSPTAFGHTFRNFSYPHAGPLRSGETTPCVVTTPGGQFVIEDTYWTEDDYVDAVGAGRPGGHHDRLSPAA